MAIYYAEGGAILTCSSGMPGKRFPRLRLHGSTALAADRVGVGQCRFDGRGQGVGAALEVYASKVAKARGCDRIEVRCQSRRQQVHQFYYRQGYAESPKYLIKALCPNAGA